MAPEEARYPADWLCLAERDLRRVRRLLDEAIVHDASLETFRSVCQKITAFYVVERYPLIIETGVTEEEVDSALEQVTELIARLRVKINGAT